MQVRIEQLLVNRSWLTRAHGVAGKPISQMITHLPALSDALFDPNKLRDKWGTYIYNKIQQDSGDSSGYTTAEQLIQFVNSCKDGIINPITGLQIGHKGKYEVYGGHHRAVLTYLKGEKLIDLKVLNWDPWTRYDITPIIAAYKKVPDSENLRQGYSYNSMQGFKSYRNGYDRLCLIYGEIINESGTKLGDLGCNDGYFGAALLQKDFTVTFIDRSPAYLNVVQEKMEVLSSEPQRRTQYLIRQGNITDVIRKENLYFDVSLYLDVFYHTVLEHGAEEAYRQLKIILDRTTSCLIFAPGRWDKLQLSGINKASMLEWLSMDRDITSIDMIGQDNDKDYRREIYSIRK